MTTYCQVCRAEIPPERVSKKARTCGDECQKQYRSQMRSERAEKACRLCGRKFRQRRTSGAVLMEHTELSEVVTPPLSLQSSPSVFFGGVSAALTSERQEHTTTEPLVVLCGKCGKRQELCNSKCFTVSMTLENEVESLCEPGAELPVESRPQVGEQDFHAAPVEISEISQNEVRG